jgi:hypothetical protein
MGSWFYGHARPAAMEGNLGFLGRELQNPNKLNLELPTLELGI